jgi:hypothetical protein
LVSTSKLDNTVSQVQLRFRVAQHSRDHPLIKSLVNYFGCGRIEVRSKRELVDFVVSKFSDINNIIIPFFSQYSLQGSKSADYRDFLTVASLMKDKSHLTHEGLAQILKIKSKMNSGRK